MAYPYDNYGYDPSRYQQQAQYYQQQLNDMYQRYPQHFQQPPQSQPYPNRQNYQGQQYNQGQEPNTPAGQNYSVPPSKPLVDDPGPQQKYLQGYPVDNLTKVRDAIVGLDGSIHVFPHFGEGCVYTKQIDNDGLPVVRRFVLDETFKMEDIAEQDSSADAPHGTPGIDPQEFKILTATVSGLANKLDELTQQLKEDKNNATANAATAATTAGPTDASSSNGRKDRAKSDGNSTTANAAKSSSAPASGTDGKS